MGTFKTFFLQWSLSWRQQWVDSNPQTFDCELIVYHCAIGNYCNYYWQYGTICNFEAIVLYKPFLYVGSTTFTKMTLGRMSLYKVPKLIVSFLRMLVC